MAWESHETIGLGCPFSHEILKLLSGFSQAMWTKPFSSFTKQLTPMWYVYEPSMHCLFSRFIAVNKMVCHFWHQFLTQFSLLFQRVPFFFLSMAALRTTNTKLSDWLLELFQPIRLWLSELPYRAKWMVPSERALKTKSETGVESFTPFC